MGAAGGVKPCFMAGREGAILISGQSAPPGESTALYLVGPPRTERAPTALPGLDSTEMVC